MISNFLGRFLLNSSKVILQRSGRKMLSESKAKYKKMSKYNWYKTNGVNVTGYRQALTKGIYFIRFATVILVITQTTS